MRHLGIVISVPLLSLVLLEAVMRILALFPADSKMYINDPDIGYRMRPNIAGRNIRTNSFGFNDYEHTRENAKDTTRIAFIGDSFVFGAVPREKNFTFLTQKLAEQAASDIEVFNMGIPAAGPKNYLSLLRHDAMAMNIAVVCVVFFIGNDVVQSHPDFRTQVWFGSTREVLRQPFLVGLSWEYSYVYRFLRAATRQMRERATESLGAAFSRATFLSIEHQRAEIYKMNPPSYIRESYAAAGTILADMAEITDKHKMKFVVVFAPDEIQVSADLRGSVAEAYGIDLAQYNFAKPQEVLGEKLRASGVLVLDLLSVFQTHPWQASLYLRHNTHWNERGNRLAADEIWSYLNAAGLLGPTALGMQGSGMRVSLGIDRQCLPPPGCAGEG